jgi:translation initiation factor IF-2
MAEEKMMRLSQVARQLNVGTATIQEVLGAKGYKVENSPNAKISSEQFDILAKEFKASALDKKEASSLTIGKKHETNLPDNIPSSTKKEKEDDLFFRPPTVIREPAMRQEEPVKQTPKPPVPATPAEDGANRHKLPGLNVIGKIELDKRTPVPPPAEPKPAPVVAPPVVADKPVEKVTPPVPEPVVAKTPEVKAPEVKAPVVEAPQPEVVKAPEVKAPEVKAPVPVEAPAPVVPQPRKPEPVVAAKPVEPAPVAPKLAPLAPVKPEPVVAKAPTPEVKPVAPAAPVSQVVTARAETLKGLTVLGKIELPSDRDRNKKKNGVAAPPATGAGAGASADDKKKAKRKRKRLRVGGEATPGQNTGTNTAARTDNKPGAPKPAGGGVGRPGDNRGKPANRPAGNPFQPREEVSDRQIQDQIKATLAKLSGGKGGGPSGRKGRGIKRANNAREEQLLQEQEGSKTLRVTEFISASDLASLMGVSVNEVISACMGLGMFVSINQRLDAEAITVISDEFGFNAEFITAEEEIKVDDEDGDDAGDLQDRAPIVTIMGHVDHGKTSLLDYIRKTRVTAGEAGGITQHIGAYDVTTDTGKRIAFLDTPGHEAFTAMRARGARITDVAIIVVAADDNVMPQTREAINHAQVAGVPIVIAINKVDKPNANPEKIREELAKENILVEDWGGKYQCQEISAKTGLGIADLLEKVLLEAELLELKANPDRNASGTVIEASLDKGRGYVTTVMVQTGTLKIGDMLLSGAHYGRVKAMTNHLGQRIKKAGPSTPVQVLGLSGAPQAGDKFLVMDTEREAREIAVKREQILREQSIRTKKHITLDEIGRRLAIGTFKELNVIVKGDVDGSIEALSDSLLRLSTEEVQVRIIHKAVGQISEGDVLLASASDAIIVGFQVRPSVNARRLAEQEEIEIRLYSIIYDAINEVKDAMEGMLAPKVEEVILGSAEVREVFKISKSGTVAGCYVLEGNIKRNAKIRLVRDGIVVHTGDIDALKRFKDDVNEVKFGYECGLSIKNFHDIQMGDTLESFEQRETKRTL